MEGPRAPDAYVAEDGLLDTKGRRALGPEKARCPSIGDLYFQDREEGVCGLVSRGRGKG